MYKGVVEAIATYAAPVWYKSLENGRRAKQLRGVMRTALTAVLRTYATVSTDSLPVLAGVIPLDLQVIRRAMRWLVSNGQARSITYLDMTGDQPLREVDEYILSRWQDRWTNSLTGRLTYSYWKDIRMRLRSVGRFPIDAFTAQFVTGHGDFRQNLVRLGLSDSEACECGAIDTPRHVLYDCVNYDAERQLLMRKLAQVGSYVLPEPEDITLRDDVWAIFAEFTRQVLTSRKTLRSGQRI